MIGHLLQINNLTVAFRQPQGELMAVKGVSLHLDAGETLALVGESGCGKTVLCKSMLKLLCEKGRIRQGEILLEQKDLVPVPEAEMQAHRGGDIAMVFQDPMTSLDPAFSVGEQIAEVLRLHRGLSRADAKAQALELMELVQIPAAAERYEQRPFQFSGGMRQRIVIAIALAGQPKLLLADEPTTALDEKTQEEILKLLKEIQGETGVAVLFITHDLSLVEDVADRVAIMQEGVIVEEGKVPQVFERPAHPYTRKLLGYLDYKKGRGHHHRSRDAAEKTTGEPILTVRGLTKRFAVKGRRHTVLDDFSMDVHRGEIVGLVGRSGCGKSTLARCIMGIEPFESGTIELGKKALSDNKSRSSVNVQMIFQDSQSTFNDRMTIEEIIAEPIQINKQRSRRQGEGVTDAAAKIRRIRTFRKKAVEKDAEKAAVLAAMQAVEMEEHLARRKPYELSGGQRQRAAIARALISEPDLIIADEPLTGLDVSAQAQIVHLFKKLAEERDLTILFIAHDLPMVNHISDRIIWI